MHDASVGGYALWLMIEPGVVLRAATAADSLASSRWATRSPPAASLAVCALVSVASFSAAAAALTTAAALAVAP